jgi:hypothetical protein
MTDVSAHHHHHLILVVGEIASEHREEIEDGLFEFNSVKAMEPAAQQHLMLLSPQRFSSVQGQADVKAMPKTAFGAHLSEKIITGARSFILTETIANSFV